MASSERYEIIRIRGLRYEGRQRRLAFLVDKKDKDIDAKSVYDSLSERQRQDVLNRFDYWMDEGVHDNYFHGWPADPNHKHCYSFRWREGRVRHRFYGFTYKPNNYLACILISHARKTQEYTDTRHLDRAEVLRDNLEVIRAIKKEFPELR